MHATTSNLIMMQQPATILNVLTDTSNNKCTSVLHTPAALMMMMRMRTMPAVNC